MGFLNEKNKVALSSHLSPNNEICGVLNGFFADSYVNEYTRVYVDISAACIFLTCCTTDNPITSVRKGLIINTSKYLYKNILHWC
jgi:hypothetical protein